MVMVEVVLVGDYGLKLVIGGYGWSLYWLVMVKRWLRQEPQYHSTTEVQIFPLFIGHKYYVDHIHLAARHHNRGLKLTNKSLEMCQLANDSLLEWHIAFCSLSCTSYDVMGNSTQYWKCFIFNRYQNHSKQLF